MQKQGTITRWDSTRAFGFIRSPGGTADVFFHLKDFRSATPPREGMAVVYDDVHVGGKGPRAVAVQPAGAAATAAPSPRSSGATRNGARPAASKASAPPSTTRTTRTPRTAARPLARAHAGSGRPAAGAGLAYTLMVLWAGMVAWGVWTQRLPLWVLGALAALNVLTLWVYAADKNAAQSGGWRTSENNLHTLGLLGGWPAAWLGARLG